MARAQYYQAGYTPPAGVNSATGVKEYQRMLGVDVDGIWGPKTQAAYDQYLAGQNTQSSASSSWRWGAPGSQDAAGQGGTDLFNRYYQTILGQLQVPTINLNIPSADAVRQQWQDALQPSLDAAISRRQSASQSIRAELDADAVSRGMGSSTYVSSLKERESAEAQEDIDELQAQYGATLAERIATSLQAYEQMRLNAQQYNLQAQAAAQQAALAQGNCLKLYEAFRPRSTQLAVIYLIALRFAELLGTVSEETYQEIVSELLTIPTKMEEVLDHREAIQYYASIYFNHESIFFIGRNIDYAIGLEGSLKLKEISYIHSEAYAAGELKHGTISLIEDGTLVVALASRVQLFDKLISNVVEVKSRGADVLGLTVASKAKEMERTADHVITVPDTHPMLLPSLDVIPMQLFAYYVALMRGCDIDKPRNLAKSVTVE